MKRKIVKSTAYFIAIVLLILSVSGCSQNHATNSGNSSSDITVSGNNSSAENNFEPQTEHISEVPDGYIGIYTVEDLKNAGYNTKGNYILMNDLDLSSVADWDGINNDSVFDGNNYTISNLKSTKVGLFWKAKSIKNLNVENIEIYFNGDEYDKANVNSLEKLAGGSFPYGLGGLAGSATSIENCVTNGKINVKSEKAVRHTGIRYITAIGGIVGFSGSGKVKNSKSGIEITVSGNSTYDIGGICGQGVANMSIEDCEFYGMINAGNSNNVGGILGNGVWVEKIDSCLNRGTISRKLSSKFSQAIYVGGIAGYSQNIEEIKNCVNTGDILETINFDEILEYHELNFGGILGNGDSTASVSNCCNAGRINVEGGGDQKK